MKWHEHPGSAHDSAGDCGEMYDTGRPPHFLRGDPSDFSLVTLWKLGIS